MAFATSAPGGLFFGLGGQLRRREAVSGAGDGGWPAGTAVVPVRSGIGLLGLGWRPIGRHRRRPDRQLAAAGMNRDARRHFGGRTVQNRCAALCHPNRDLKCTQVLSFCGIKYIKRMIREVGYRYSDAKYNYDLLKYDWQ